MAFGIILAATGSDLTALAERIDLALSALQPGGELVVVTGRPLSAGLPPTLRARAKAAQWQVAISNPQHPKVDISPDGVTLYALPLGCTLPFHIALETALIRSTASLVLVFGHGVTLCPLLLDAMVQRLVTSEADGVIRADFEALLIRRSAISDLLPLSPIFAGHEASVLATLAQLRLVTVIDDTVGKEGTRDSTFGAFIARQTAMLGITQAETASGVTRNGTSRDAALKAWCSALLFHLDDPVTGLAAVDPWSGAFQAAPLANAVRDLLSAESVRSPAAKALVGLADNGIWRTALTWDAARRMGSVPGADRSSILKHARDLWERLQTLPR